MRILHISDTDLVGARFNGYELCQKLGAKHPNIQCEMLVWQKESKSEFVNEFLPKTLARFLSKFIFRIERRLSLQAVFHLGGWLLFFKRAFWRADLIHLHTIQNHFFSLLSLPLLSRVKPVVWTLHDPWAFTGHCIYPRQCQNWRSGCGNCPDLSSPMFMRDDRTHFNWSLKKFVYKHSRIEFIVASEWMRQLFIQSPLTSEKAHSLVSFGLETSVFNEKSKSEARKKLNISDDELVIGIRATKNPYKGFELGLEALKLISQTRRITVLTFEDPVTSWNPESVRVVNRGWLNDETNMAVSYQSCDLFLAPSNAEAFGLMAIEAMACGVPVIFTKGTSLESVVNEAGVSCENTPDSLANAAIRLIEDQQKYEKICGLARNRALAHYNLESFCDNLTRFYERALKDF